MNDPPLSPRPDAPPQPQHETSDASPAMAGLFVLGLVVMIVVLLPLLRWLFWNLEQGAANKDPAQSPVAGRQIPPEPQLQVSSAADLARVRRGEEDRLSSYGWLDRQQQAVHLPIERAIQILAEQGFPEPAGTAGTPAKEERP